MSVALPEPDLGAVDGLVRREGRLSWGGVELSSLAQTHGTPLHVVSHQVLAARIEDLRAQLTTAGVRHRIYFSVKTNPLVDVLRARHQHDVGVEFSSAADLWLARRAGHAGEQVVMGGAVMDAEFLDEAVHTRPALLNVESLDVLERVIGRAPLGSAPLHVGLRLNPSLARPAWDVLGHSGSNRSHFGFPVDGDAIEQALTLLAARPNVALRGLHVHLGTNLSSTNPWSEALPSIVRTWERARAKGLTPTILDIGGGFPARVSPPPRVTQVLRRLLSSTTHDVASSPPSHLVGDVASCVRAAFERAALAVPEIFVEPGRALTGDAQLLLARVARVTRTPHGEHIAICDAGALGVSPLLLIEHHPVVLVNRDDDERVEVTLMGPMPTSIDRLAPTTRLPPLSAGDVVAVLGTGAYFTSMATTFAGPRPPIVAIDLDGSTRLVRRRETLRELVARDTDA